ncbi:MAG: outer membrane beta-barrel protein [Spirochaetes bacterium]|jgi:hypothetical protein|nr:outer membrane beta-barrel protein [Spirochaetota bacterium]
MKRTLILAIVLLLGAALTVPAQDISVQAGGKAGLNFGWFSGDDWSDLIDAQKDASNGVGVGFTLGGFIELGFSERFAAQPEILFFSQKGKLRYEDENGDDATLVNRINTIQIPLLAKALFPIDEGTLYGILGPSIFLAVGDVKATVDVDGDKNSSTDAPDNRLLFGLALGAGYEYPVDPGVLIGELRYTRVLSRYENNADVFGNSLSLLVGYGIPIE